LSICLLRLFSVVACASSHCTAVIPAGYLWMQLNAANMDSALSTQFIAKRANRDMPCAFLHRA
jgi:hypothetical protein